MYLKSLSLQDFRNYSKKTFEFSFDTTLIVGPNASGKTNILEAIYLLSRGRSFRAKKELEMISYDGELARTEGSFLNKREAAHDTFSESSLRELGGRGSHKVLGPRLNISSKDHFAPSEKMLLEIILTNGEVQSKPTAKKLFKINGVGKRMMDFIGSFKSVLFRPEDIDIVLGSPSVRRNYLDSVLDLVDKEYRVCNVVYKKGLRQRNKLLEGIRQGWAKKSQLEYWNRLVIKNGQIISKKREELIEIFNFQFSIFKNKKGFGDLIIDYDKSAISKERLEKYQNAELALGSTLVGPHRDDLKYKIADLKLNKTQRDLNSFGSRGEQRMTVLALKLAELAFVEKESGEKPLLLLDDIFSELDREHRNQVLSLIGRQQTILTTTEADLVKKKFLDKMEKIVIK